MSVRVVSPCTYKKKKKKKKEEEEGENNGEGFTLHIGLSGKVE